MNATYTQPGAILANRYNYPTYNLKGAENDPVSFYSILEKVTGNVVKTGLEHFRKDISRFSLIATPKNQVSKTSEQEYLIEILMIGTFWNLYQGKWLNIPSQCVYLDFSGCKQHWTHKGIPTELSVNRVIQLLNPAAPEIQRIELLKRKPTFSLQTTVA